MELLKNNWRYLVFGVCIFVLASCSMFGEVAHKTKLAILQEDTEAVKQQRWDKEGKPYEMTAPLPKGTVVVPNPLKK